MRKLFVAPMLAAVAFTACLFAPSRAHAQDADPAPPPSPPATSSSTSDSTLTESSAKSDDPPVDTKDDDLGLEWVWLNADIGYSYADLKSAQLAISPAGGSPVSVVDATSSGLMYGFGGGIRLLFLTIGIRARNHSAMNLWQIDGEIAFHGRMGHIDPYFAGRFGYDTVGTLSQSVDVAGSSVVPPSVSVHGFNGGLAIGLDYYFNHFLSLGIEGAGDVIYLKRPASSPPALTADQQAAINADATAKANYQKLQDAYQASASSVGFGAALSAHVGVHF